MSCSCHVHMIFISSYHLHIIPNNSSMLLPPCPPGPGTFRSWDWDLDRQAMFFLKGERGGSQTFGDSGPLNYQGDTPNILLMGPGLGKQSSVMKGWLMFTCPNFWCPYFFQVHISWNWVSIYMRRNILNLEGFPKISFTHSLLRRFFKGMISWKMTHLPNWIFCESWSTNSIWVWVYTPMKNVDIFRWLRSISPYKKTMKILM